MKRKIDLWQLAGFAGISVLGTLLHFLYDLTKIPPAALFSSTNESTWEHMKLLFFPMLLFAIAESFFLGRDFESFWCIKLKGTVLGVMLIPIIFYTLNGVFGPTPDFVSIALFFVSAAVALIFEARLFKKGSIPCRYEKLCFSTLCLIAVAFWVFTFMTPKLPIFKDPVSGSYGF